MSLSEPSAVIDAAAREVVDAALKIHRALGPGLLESHYREALGHELRARGRTVQVEVPATVVYEGRPLKKKYYLDMLVDNGLS